MPDYIPPCYDLEKGDDDRRPRWGYPSRIRRYDHTSPENVILRERAVRNGRMTREEADYLAAGGLPGAFGKPQL